ncbi:MAG TPA: TRAP transporter small permease subunit [Pseudomonadaceae bacterium]|nr:TRAP transporter small permease subunit [Pseudomonadaceae bacterium]
MFSPPRPLQLLLRCLDGITAFIGAFIPWLTLALVLVTCVVVIMRYAFSTGSIALQESMIYLHSAIFMLGMAWTLRQGGHVRVDVFYRDASPRVRAWVDVAGGLVFLLPLCVLIFWMSWDYVINSWAIREKSSEGTGLPYVYLLKTLLLAMPVTLLLQGVAETLRNLLLALGFAAGNRTAEPGNSGREQP